MFGFILILFIVKSVFIQLNHLFIFKLELLVINIFINKYDNILNYINVPWNCKSKI